MAPGGYINSYSMNQIDAAGVCNYSLPGVNTGNTVSQVPFGVLNTIRSSMNQQTFLYDASRNQLMTTLNMHPVTSDNQQNKITLFGSKGGACSSRYIQNGVVRAQKELIFNPNNKSHELSNQRVNPEMLRRNDSMIMSGQRESELQYFNRGNRIYNPMNSSFD